MRGLKVVATALLLLGFATAGCKNLGTYVWVDDLPLDTAGHEYRIQKGDKISIHVFGQDAMSVSARVRSDGMLAFPILGDIVVEKKRPADLAKEFESRLTQYVVTPHVTVTVEEVRPMMVLVMGEVLKPAAVPLDATAGVVQAILAAGGPTENADKDAVFVVRNGQRIRFKLENLTRGEGRAAKFTLQQGDMVVVE